MRVSSRWLFLFLLAMPMPLKAAEIAVIDARTLSFDEVVAGACSLTLTGPIVPGDADRLRGLLEQKFPLEHDDFNPSLCLDSPGGSLDEGVKIAEVLGGHFTATIVPAGAECLSACAVAFMGGTFGWYEYIFNMRIIHPDARLGFHAPALDIAEGNYTGESVKRAFDVAVDAIARIAGDMDKTHITGTINRFPRSLLAAMLVHRGEDFLWIDTVEKAGAWDIWVKTDASPQLDDVTLTRGCKTAARWLADAPKFIFDPNDWDLSGEWGEVSGGPTEWRVEYGDLFMVECTVKREESGDLTFRLNRDGIDLGEISLRAWMAFPPDMPLTDLR